MLGDKKIDYTHDLASATADTIDDVIGRIRSDENLTGVEKGYFLESAYKKKVSWSKPARKTFL
jgi:hypothetical protein